MHLQELILRDFRNYTDAQFAFELGPNTLIGPNGQGKTNAVEAIGYLATATSHRISGDSALIRQGTSTAFLHATVASEGRSVTVDLALAADGPNQARINGGSPVRPREIGAVVRCVIFAPEDLALVKGDPSTRRRMVDEIATARAPRLASVRADVDRVLRQRSTLLKSARSAPRSNDIEATLEVWDAQLARAAAPLVSARARALILLAPLLDRAYTDVSGSSAGAAATYSSTLGPVSAEDDATIEAEIIRQLVERRREEIDRAQCLVGPHRDEVVFSLDGMPARQYASQGESWSLALALRMATYDLLTDDNLAGGEPVLVLDDVFAQLDPGRRSALADLVLRAPQVIITAAAEIDVPSHLHGTRFQVRAGEVTRD